MSLLLGGCLNFNPFETELGGGFLGTRPIPDLLGRTEKQGRAPRRPFHNAYEHAPLSHGNHLQRRKV